MSDHHAERQRMNLGPMGTAFSGVRALLAYGPVLLSLTPQSLRLLLFRRLRSQTLLSFSLRLLRTSCGRRVMG